MSASTGLNRRAFLTIGTVAAAAGFAGCSGTARRSNAGKGAVPLSASGSFNYILGAQTIGATYQFTQESVLVETAQAILEMGSNLLKFAMGRGYERMMLKPSHTAYPETMQYLLNQGADAQTAPRIKFPSASIEPPPAGPAPRGRLPTPDRAPAAGGRVPPVRSEVAFSLTSVRHLFYY
jgi:hypothetical protein